MNEQEIEKPMSPAPRGRKALREMALSFAVMLALALFVRDFKIPNPNMILITGLSVFTSLYGYHAGIVCGAVMLGYSMYFFSDDHSFFAYSALNAQKMATILLGVVCNVLFIGHLHKAHTDAERQLMELNAVLRSDNITLEQASALDALTGTRNRYAFRRDYAKYESRDIHAMMFDLDDFKTKNDAYGHAVGDFVLKSAGRFLREAFGDACCYRYGGDEFVVICPDMPEADFAAKLERVRDGMRGLSLDEQRIPASFSAGYVYGHAELSDDLRLMLRQADYNLYESKKRGKDRFTGAAYSREFAQKLEQRKDLAN